jgi:hypothetical protein
VVRVGESHPEEERRIIFGLPREKLYRLVGTPGRVVSFSRYRTLVEVRRKTLHFGTARMATCRILAIGLQILHNVGIPILQIVPVVARYHVTVMKR